MTNNKTYTCENCKHYRQHYTYSAGLGKFIEVECGHCKIKIKDKNCTDENKICKNFEIFKKQNLIKEEKLTFQSKINYIYKTLLNMESFLSEKQKREN